MQRPHSQRHRPSTFRSLRPHRRWTQPPTKRASVPPHSRSSRIPARERSRLKAPTRISRPTEKFLYVRFDASQKEKIGTGDYVGIDLWPSGSGGSLYRFAASPNGTKDANTAAAAAAPSWEASGTTFDGGYAVTMKIPLAGLHGVSGSGPWNVQLVRSIGANGQELVWSHDGTPAPPDDVAQAGTMTLPAAVSSL